MNEKHDMNDLIGEMHFRPCIFDRGVKNKKLIDREIQEKINELIKKYGNAEKFKKKLVYNKHILGVCMVFDIDAPPSKTGFGKQNMFDDDIFEQFMTIKCVTEELLKNVNLKCISSTTGNGFNITSEPYWLDERDSTFEELVILFNSYVDYLNKMYHKDGGVGVDASEIYWSLFKKMVFTYHGKWNRITIPVSKGIIDKEWLKKITDLDYFLNDEKNNIDEVIQKSEWDNDKWW